MAVALAVNSPGGLPVHAETEALLLAALYRIETRPEAVHTVVDQAVAASATLVGGALKGCFGFSMFSPSLGVVAGRR